MLAVHQGKVLNLPRSHHQNTSTLPRNNPAIENAAKPKKYIPYEMLNSRAPNHVPPVAMTFTDQFRASCYITSQFVGPHK